MHDLIIKCKQLEQKERTFDPDLHSTLYKYAQKVDHITELGVRWVESTFSFLRGTPKKLISYDIDHPSIHTNFDGEENLELAYEYAKLSKTDFEFKLGNSLTIDIEPTDLLFIDTQHSYLHLKHELYFHNSKVKKYILMHDTVAHKYTDQTRPASSNDSGYTELDEITPGDHKIEGMGNAIENFLQNHDEWILEEEIKTGQGLTILKRI